MLMRRVDTSLIYSGGGCADVGLAQYWFVASERARSLDREHIEAERSGVALLVCSRCDPSEQI
jgi:hypothetical protein